MSYQPKYTSEKYVERLVRFDITNETSPSSIEVNEIIEEVENEIDNRKLGWADDASYGTGYSISNLYIDVPGDEDETVTEVYLRGYPIISMISLYRRTSSELYDTPVWEELTQGYYEGWTEASDSHYKLIEVTGRDGQKYGIGFYFYKKKPKSGKARLKASFTYSYLVPQTILREYASLRVAVRVLELAIASGEPTRISEYTGGELQSFVASQFNAQISNWKKRIEEIEEKHFPRVESGPISY